MNYFSGDYKVPKPLNQEEFNYHFQNFKNGSLESRQIIIEHNLRLVFYRVSSRFYTTVYDKSELISMGIIGLIKAVDSFNPEKNIKFSTYASMCIDNEILMLIRKNNKHINNISLNEPIIGYNVQSDEITLEDTLYDPNSDVITDYEDKETNEIIKELVEKLPNKEKEFIKLAFGFGDKKYTQQEIAKLFGISQTQVSRTIKKIIKNLKTQYKEISINDISNPNQEISGKIPQKLKNKESTIQSEELLNFLTPQELKIVYLKLGYPNGICYTTEQISQLLNIDPEEVIKTTKKALLLFKEVINQFMDKTIDSTEDEQLKHNI